METKPLNPANKKGVATKRRVSFVSKLIDKVLLLITALLVGLGIYGFIVFVHRIGIPREWILFVCGSVTYMAVMLYAAFTFRTFRKSSRRIIRLALLSFFIGAPILFAFTIFYSNLLPLPKNLVPYLFGGTFVAATSMVCFEYLLRFLERKKSKKRA
jgi:hypothetical protein